MKKILIHFLLLIASHVTYAETQLFSNFDNPLFEKNREFIEHVHKQFSFDKAVVEIFISQTKGPILNSSASQASCIKTLGGDFVFATDLLQSKKYDEYLRNFFKSTDGLRKAKVFSGIILGTLEDTERNELLSISGKSKLIGEIVNKHFISLLLSTHQSAFEIAAQSFFAAHCPR